MRVLRHWQGRGTLSASGSSLLRVGYYCQEIETTPQDLRPPLLEVNGTITSDDVHTLTSWYREKTRLTLETDELTLQVYLIDPCRFHATSGPAFKQKQA